MKQSALNESIRQLIFELHCRYGWFNKEEIEHTPERIANFYREIYNQSDNNWKFTQFELEENKSMVMLKDIDFYSLCAHHLLPFYGKATIAYLPREGGKICGVSKLARTVVTFASKPQTQEKMANEIADYLNKELKPWFVMVIIEAEHLCMLMRGVKQYQSKMVTSTIRWDKKKFKQADLIHLKQEVLELR